MIENILEHPVEKIICSHEQPQKYLSCSIGAVRLWSSFVSFIHFISCACDRGRVGVRSFLCMKRLRLGSNFLAGRVHILFIILSSACSSMICKCLSGERIVWVNKAGGKWLVQGHENSETRDLSLLILLARFFSLATHYLWGEEGRGDLGFTQTRAQV